MKTTTLPICLTLLCAVGLGPLTAAESTKPKVIALQLNQEQDYDLGNVGAYLGVLELPERVPNWTVTSSPNVEATKVSATIVRIKVKAKGVQSFRFLPSGTGSGLPVSVVGYEIDRSGLYSPRVIDNDSSGYDRAKPLTLIATLRMSPYVPGVQYDASFFAHRTTFIDNARSFRVTTGDATTSLGEPGFAIETASDGSKIGVLTFTMFMPANENSWCLQTTQSQQWSPRFPAPSASN